MFRRPCHAVKLLPALPLLLCSGLVQARAVAHARRASPAASFAAAADGPDRPALERARALLETVRPASYPELKGADIRLRLFSSDRDFFRAKFAPCRFLTGRRMRFVIHVNPKAFEWGAPEEGLRAVMAHELAHVLHFSQGKRVRLLGLARLVSEGHAARFERRADLVAVARGYGEGLREYRRWLYRHVTPEGLPEKRRNYFSPEEIDALLSISGRRPEALRHWLKRVPRNVREILEYDARSATRAGVRARAA